MTKPAPPARGMRILKIWDAEYPWDVRAEKVCRALTDHGHSVRMVARNRDRRPVHEALPECDVVRMAPFPFVPRRIEAVSQFPAFFNPRWMRLIRREARGHGAEVLLVRDLPLAPTAIWAGKALGVPVVLDMAENYPAMMNDLWLTGTQGPLDVLVRNPRIVRRVEDWTVSRVDHVLVVVEESASRLAGAGVPVEKITVVSNTPPLERVASRPRPKPEAGRPVRIAYLGLMEEARGVRTLLEAAAACRGRGLALQLDLVGDGRDLVGFKELSAAAGLTDSVTFHGFLPHKEALRVVGEADWGVIPHHANEAWNTTIPNKLFDYMAAGLPVASSDAVPVERVVGETGCGAIFPDRDSEALAGIFTGTTLSDAWRMGEAGRRVALDRYHWEKDATRLVQAMNGLVAGPSISGRTPAEPVS